MSVEEAAREVAVIGGTLDLGAGRRGVDMGPSAIRYAGLEQQLTEKLGVHVADEGNVISPVVETAEVGDEHARYLPQILDLCDRVARLVAGAAQRGAMPLVLGGDHSVALGTLVGMALSRGPGGVVWVDAHGDVNTPKTSPTGNVHGMVLAAALGMAGDAFRREGWAIPAVEPGK
ncbi:MAG TPA: arginase family protein, partial [Gaiellaceae bacterium]|nr:arginase family protein [Gaiellaceae bacterium]